MTKSSEPSWESLALVCRECRKRSNGPRGFKTREVVQELRKAVRGERPRVRVLSSDCLGMCPKRAVAIARVGGQHVAWWAAVESPQRVEELLAFDRARQPGRNAD